MYDVAWTPPTLSVAQVMKHGNLIMRRDEASTVARTTRKTSATQGMAHLSR